MTGSGLRWSSILVDCKCCIRLKKSSLGMVLFRAIALEAGSVVLCSSIRELYNG